MRSPTVHFLTMAELMLMYPIGTVMGNGYTVTGYGLDAHDTACVLVNVPPIYHDIAPRTVYIPIYSDGSHSYALTPVRPL